MAKSDEEFFVPSAQWIAHVHYPDNSVKEVMVEALSGHKFAALQKVYKAIGVSGPNDPKITGVTIMEEGKTKKYKAGKRLKPEVILGAHEGDLANFKRYRVSLFPSPASAVPRIQVLKAETPFDALSSVAQLAGQPEVEKLGPYVVEIANPGNGWEVKMQKQSHAFATTYTPPVTPPSGPAVAHRPQKKKKNKTHLVSSVAELFRLEKKVQKAYHTVTQG